MEKLALAAKLLTKNALAAKPLASARANARQKKQKSSFPSQLRK
jgi:hypothetical protein